MKKTLLVLILAVLAAAAAFGCSKSNGSSAVPANGTVTESSAVSQAASSGGTAESEAAASSQAESSGPVLSEPASSQNGPVIDITTDDKAFDAKFKLNPIDKSYIKESAAAVSNIDMVNVSNKYAEAWQKEIGHAWSELQKYKIPDTLTAGQKSWEDGKAAALQKIAADAQASGGTMAQVDASSKAMDFYRGRANALYRALYAYDKNYTYAWAG